MIRCPICGKTVKSMRRHLKKAHDLRFPDEDFALSFIKLYRLFKKRGYRFPFASPNELSYDDFINILKHAARVFHFSKRAIVLLEPYLRYFAFRYSQRILEEFPSLARSRNRILRALAFVTLTFVPSEQAIPIVLSLCNKKRSRFLKYIVALFNRYKDSLMTYIKRLLDSKAEFSISCVLKAVFIVIPEVVYTVLDEFISKNLERIAELYDEFSDLFEYLISFPRRYLEKKNIAKAITVLANIKFFRTLESKYSQEDILRFVRVYLLLRTLDDLWSRLYFGCQKGKTYMIKNELMGRSTGGKLSSLILRIAEILEQYPSSCRDLDAINFNEYLDVAREIGVPYIRAYFLYLMIDINTKNGNLENAKKLLEELEKNIEWQYDFLPHAYLLGALIMEFSGALDDAEAYYRKIISLGVHWEKELLDQARLYALLGRYDEALSLLSKVSEVPYKHILRAYIYNKTGNYDEAERIMNILSKAVITKNPEEALAELQALERICYCLYDHAWKIAIENNILQNILDIQAMTCSRHFKHIVKYFYEKEPNNSLVKYYMGVINLLDENYSVANKFFKEVSIESIEPLVYLLNALFAAIMADDKEWANEVANRLLALDVDDESKTIALAYYYAYVGAFDKAMGLLRANKRSLDYEVYLELKKELSNRKLSYKAYTFYLTSRRLPHAVCPLLSIKLVI